MFFSFALISRPSPPGVWRMELRREKRPLPQVATFSNEVEMWRSLRAVRGRDMAATCRVYNKMNELVLEMSPGFQVAGEVAA